MRYQPEHKEQVHSRIVATAAGEFRSHGIDSVGIAKLMALLDMTHGGFYAHFPDKESLVTAAVDLAFDQSLNAMRTALSEGGIEGMIAMYLSEGHRDSASIGCPIPSLSAELARRPQPSRAAFTAKLAAFMSEISHQVPGDSPEERMKNVQFLYSALAGAIALSRAVSDAQVSREILRSTKEKLTEMFCNP